MVMNVPMGMIVHIAHGQRKDTRKKQRWKIQWEDAWYTNVYGKHTVSNVPDGVGREKEVVKRVSFKKY